tara:strand:+ start:34 stop:351 length:318 start_codon:yes stop_codon:yes gene_type:complete
MFEPVTTALTGAKAAMTMGSAGLLLVIVGLSYTNVTAKAVEVTDRVKILESNYVALNLKLQGVSDQLKHNDEVAKLIRKTNDAHYDKQAKLLERIFDKIDKLEAR